MVIIALLWWLWVVELAEGEGNGKGKDEGKRKSDASGCAVLGLVVRLALLPRQPSCYHVVVEVMA